MEVKYFVAKSNKQLGTCLRALHAIKNVSKVDISKTENDKLEYHVFADVSDEEFKQIEQSYKIMISE